MSLKKKYSEYLSPDEISEYLDESGILVAQRIPKNISPKRRQTAWEFMGQEPPAKYISCISNLFEGSKAEASSSSAPAEVFDVEAEISTLNNIEVQAVKIVSESPWHLWQAGVLTLRNIEGQRVNNDFGEAVIIVRECWKMSGSQKRALLTEGVSRHVWQRCPLAGHSVFFMTRAWELGRMSAYVKNFSSVEEKVNFQRAFEDAVEVGWLRDIPVPHDPEDDSQEALARSVVEKNEYMKDQGEVRMFQVFSEGIEDLYNGFIDKFVRDTPALWDEFVMRTSTGEYYLVDPDPWADVPTEPTAENLCLDIHNNVKFSPKLCLWAIERKLDITGEKLYQVSLLSFAIRN